MTVTFAGYPEAHGSVSDIAIVGVCASQALCIACGLELTRAERCEWEGCVLEHGLNITNVEKFDQVLYSQATKALQPALGPAYTASLIHYNDQRDVGRTKQDIIDLFKNTAKGLRNDQ